MKILLYFRILIPCVFCRPDWKTVLFSQFSRIICSLKHICLMELFTNWSIKLTLFFRANIFSNGIASLLICSFRLVLESFRFYPLSNNAFYCVQFYSYYCRKEVSWSEYNNSDIFCDLTTKEHILLNSLLMKLLRLYK